jgi:uncharacterized cupredoxin-like copper-binding protein
MSYTLRIVLVSIVLALLGCSGISTDAPTVAPPGYRTDAVSRAASVDWTRTKNVTVSMDEYDFMPSSLSLESGTPYHLHIENAGGKSHTFSSASFFKTIAARRLTTRAGTVETPFIQELVVAPGQAADLEFVALEPGDYPLVCNEPLHEIFGMTGAIHVQ